MCSSNSSGLMLVYLHIGHCKIGTGLCSFKFRLERSGGPAPWLDLVGLISPFRVFFDNSFKLILLHFWFEFDGVKPLQYSLGLASSINPMLSFSGVRKSKCAWFTCTSNSADDIADNWQKGHTPCPSTCALFV